MLNFFKWTIPSDAGTQDFLHTRCSEILAELGAMSPASAIDQLADPRAIHYRLYSGLTPPDHPEVAGNYRGSAHPALRDYMVYFSFTETEGTTRLVRPAEVAGMMIEYGRLLRLYVRPAASTKADAFKTSVAFMVFFGKVHPFVDGNGHVQRLSFQHLLERAGFQMAPAWRIHPCPYGEDVHRALAAEDHAAVATLLTHFAA